MRHLLPILLLLLVPQAAAQEAAESTPEAAINRAIDRLSAATAPGGGGAEAYGAELTDTFSRWTLGSRATDTKESWLAGIRSWFDEGWVVIDRETHHITIDVEGGLAFVRRVVSESYQGPDGEITDPARAAVSEVWKSTREGWKLHRVEVVSLPDAN
ncbi:MAG: hypothetical protein JJ896_17630 [Rhodothermales bacterium]|nr:hypothetical protein [Rhodothermales bacterium]MBO6781483.1 hypothetical protein [Rhodothermales bacterium]